MITNTGSLCSNILNEETTFRPFQKNTGNFILSDIHLPCCVYIESANEGISEIDAAACCGLGVQCDSQENTSVNPQNNTPPRPALLLSLAPARQHVCVMQVCAWCGRRCNMCTLLGTSGGRLARYSLWSRQRSGCPVLFWTSREQPHGSHLQELKGPIQVSELIRLHFPSHQQCWHVHLPTAPANPCLDPHLDIYI